MKKRTLSKLMIVGLLSFVLIVGFSGLGIGAEQKKEIPVKEVQQPSPSSKVPGKITDGGGWESYDPGVDLVVSKVEVNRGTFGGEKKIQIIPSVKNMWKGKTSARIKILLDGLALAEWIEGGIGPNEEKRGGALYVSDPESNRSLSFTVEVDNGNAIPENNETNNRCGVGFRSSDTRIIHLCTIVGPHEPLK